MTLDSLLDFEDRYVGRSDALTLAVGTVPVPGWSMEHFEAKDSVWPRIEPRTALIYVGIGQITLNPFPPLASNLPTCSLCQRRCRPFGACG